MTLVAVSKTFGAEEIRPFLDAGQRVFGENRVQEAEAKWPELRASYDDIELHLIGPLQTNKAREAVALFDVIETVDREKLAVALKAEMERAGQTPAAVGAGQYRARAAKGRDRPRRGGGIRRTLPRRCMGSTIDGLMAIPPDGVPPGPYFAQLAVLGRGGRASRSCRWG